MNDHREQAESWLSTAQGAYLDAPREHAARDAALIAIVYALLAATQETPHDESDLDAQ